MKQPATGTTDATSATSNVANAALEIVKSPNFIKVAALSLLSLSLVILFYHFPSSFSLSFTSAISAFSSAATSSFYIPPPPSWPANPRRTGIVDENGAMTVEFEIGQFDPNALDELTYLKGGREEADVKVRIRRNKYKLCDESKREFIPCLDNGEESMRLNLSGSVQKFERHCPKEGQGLDCLVPMPKGYRKPIPWPRSRDEVWFSNVPHTRLVEARGGQNWITLKNDKFIFPGGGTQFIHGADQYLDQISQMVPDIAFGRHTHTALDIGCGVASFGAFLLQRNATTLSVAPKDVHENQIQFALERGVPAMIAVFGTRRLLYPSQAFDLIHCSRCRIDWTHDDGILLLEANRMLRAGGYFVWGAQPVYKHQDNPQQQWKAMLNLTSHICWELVKKEGYIAIWQKPLNNSCYLNRAIRAQPPLCDSNDDPDDVWYVNLRACISLLPENGYGANLTTWPTRLHDPPNRLKSIKMDASISRKELLKAESTYWYEVIDGYIAFMHWKEMNFHNVMDMRAGFGGFAAALHDHQIDCWVMNVVPVSEFNTLPVIYDRGLIGVMHDWPFDTYPRTYDLLHAAGLFSAEQKRNKCNISSIMLEMDRMLRPGGVIYVHDVVSVMDELQDIATAMGWTFSLRDTAEGPHSIWKVLVCDKRMALKLRSVGAYPVYFLIDNKFMNGSQEEWRRRKRARKQREKKKAKNKGLN